MSWIRCSNCDLKFRSVLIECPICLHKRLQRTQEMKENKNITPALIETIYAEEMMEEEE